VVHVVFLVNLLKYLQILGTAEHQRHHYIDERGGVAPGGRRGPSVTKKGRLMAYN
jgi:hypothetical protein